MQAMTNHDSSAAPAKKRGERTCAGCGKHAAAEEFVRVVHDPGTGELAVDLAASGFGRGAHVHPAAECVAKALKGGLARVFKARVVADAGELPRAIVRAADRRIEGLLTGARRAGQLAVGADAVVEALKRRRDGLAEGGGARPSEARAEIVVVARDAAAAARLDLVERAIASGKAVAFADKQRLGSLMGRDEVAVIAVLHPGVAAAIARTYRMSAPFRELPGVDGPESSPATADARGEEAWSLSEVR